MPERCGLQDFARGVFDPWFAGESGSGRSCPGGLRGTASSSQASRTATSASCHCRPGGRPNPQPPCADDILAPTGGVPPDPSEGVPPPRIPPAKTPTIGAPSNRTARCNPSAALTNSCAFPFRCKFRPGTRLTFLTFFPIDRPVQQH